MTVWSIADVTRERERQENVFQELQHAIDYLDHAPAGFFSVDGDGRHRLSQRDAWRLARPRPGAGRLPAALTLTDIVAGEGAALLTTLNARAGRREDRGARSRSAARAAASRCRCGCFIRSRSAPTARRACRAPWCSTAREDDGTDPQRAAEVRFMRFFQNTPMAIATVDKAGGIARSNAPLRLGLRSGMLDGRRPFDPDGGGRARPAGARGGDRARRRRAGRHRAGGRGARRGQGERWAQLLRLGGRGRRPRRRGGHRLRARDHRRSARWRTSVNQQQKMEIGRPTRRRHRPRLQQRAVRHHDGDRLPAERAQADRSVVPGHHRRSSRTPTAPRLWCGSCSPSRASRRLRPQVLDLGETLSRPRHAAARG